MKTLFIALVLIGLTWTGRGQGIVIFNNRDTALGVDAPIFDMEGLPCSGAAFKAQLYYSLPGVNNFLAVGDALIFRTATRAGYTDSNVDTTRYIPGIPNGANADLQVRAWQTSAGATYEEALAVGRAASSLTFTVQLSGGGLGLPAGLSGMKSFQIPEPSAVGLGLVGAGVLFLRRWK